MENPITNIMHRPAFFKDDSTWSPISLPPSLYIEDRLPPAVYEPVIIKSQEGLKLLFETKGLFILPNKLYGTAIVDKDCIIRSYQLNEGNLGVLLSGVSGAGKSLLAKFVCNEAVQKLGLPVLIITKDTIEYIKMITEIFLIRNQQVVFFIDEFDKITQTNRSSSHSGGIEETQRNQHELLSILDGYLDTHNLYLFTVNDTKYVNKYFFNRPSRIRYHYRFNGLSLQICNELIDDLLINKQWIDTVRRIFFQVKTPSFDLLNEFILECNRFPDTNPEELIRRFNVDYTNKILKKSYRVNLTVDGKQISEILNNYITDKNIYIDSIEFGDRIQLKEITTDLSVILDKYRSFFECTIRTINTGSKTRATINPSYLTHFEFLNDGGIHFRFKMDKSGLLEWLGYVLSPQYGGIGQERSDKPNIEDIVNKMLPLEYSVYCTPIQEAVPIVGGNSLSEEESSDRYDSPF